MKIYILPVDERFRPKKQKKPYPAHNIDYSVEQDFERYLENNSDLIVGSPDEADWHYLPIYWTRYRLNRGNGRKPLPDLQCEFDSVVIDDSKTFTICQHDAGELTDLGNIKMGLSSRKDDNPNYFDIPLLSQEHKPPRDFIEKKWLASFMGRTRTHSIREAMFNCLADRDDVNLKNIEHYPPDWFVTQTLKSYISLCPRGSGGSSFRIYEAMQLGVMPLIIGTPDTRPFKKWINAIDHSMWLPDCKDLSSWLDFYGTDFGTTDWKISLLQDGKKAKAVYDKYYAYQKWCKYALMELEEYGTDKKPQSTNS